MNIKNKSKYRFILYNISIIRYQQWRTVVIYMVHAENQTGGLGGEAPQKSPPQARNFLEKGRGQTIFSAILNCVFAQRDIYCTLVFFNTSTRTRSNKVNGCWLKSAQKNYPRNSIKQRSISLDGPRPEVYYCRYSSLDRQYNMVGACTLQLMLQEGYPKFIDPPVNIFFHILSSISH